MKIVQRVAVLIDGNNIGLGIHAMMENTSFMPNWDKIISRLVGERELVKVFYFREGRSISVKLAERLRSLFYGVVVPCGKSADVQLTIQAVQLVDKVDTIVLLSGDVDYLPLITFLKSRGIRVEVCGVQSAMSAELGRCADSVTFILPDDCFKINSITNENSDS